MDKKNKEIHKTSIGGQAVMEGVMMRGPKEIATAVRKSNGVCATGRSSPVGMLSGFTTVNRDAPIHSICSATEPAP